MKLFLDTNVLVDYYGSREPYCRNARKIVMMQLFGDAELWVSAKSFTDVFYICKKAVSSEKLQQAFRESYFFEICSTTGEDIRQAAKLKWDDFEDCLINVAAEKVRADCIITRDRSGFEKSKIPIMTPAELLEWLLREKQVEYAEVEL